MGCQIEIFRIAKREFKPLNVLAHIPIWSTRIFPSSKAVLPRKTTLRTFPFTFQPSKGVQLQRVNCSAALISYIAFSSTSTQVSGWSGRLNIFLGLVYIFCDQIVQCQTSRSSTAVSNNGRMVSSPGNPGGGLSESFSSIVCGAWSVAKQSITSMFSHSASTSSFVAKRGRTSPLPGVARD